MEIGLAALTVDGRLPSLQEVKSFEKKLGRHVDTVNWFMGFNGDTHELPLFPSQEAGAYKNQNIILMLTWEPWGENRYPDGRLKDPFLKINDGLLDEYIRQYARQMKALTRPVRLRFAHEMIQDDNPESKGWYPWQDFPEEFKSAYIRIYNIFKEEKARNVQFVWAPNFLPSETAVLKKYYPGPDYVDWIGLDGYNWDGQDFDGVFKKIYNSVVNHPEVFGNKPIMLSEFAVGEEPAKFKLDKPAWIRDAFSKIRNNYSCIRAFYWFQVKKERDWRLDSSQESWVAFKTAMGLL